MQKPSDTKAKFSLIATAQHMDCLKTLATGYKIFSYVDNNDSLGDPMKGIYSQGHASALLPMANRLTGWQFTESLP